MNLGMWLRELGRIGWSENDSEDQRLQKSALTYCTVLITLLAFVWVGTYWYLGLHLSAALPAVYQILSIGGLGLFWRTKRLRHLRDLQLTLMLLLPFVLQWSLGGFIAASVVALWALVAPLGAMIFGARAVPWFGGFLVLLAISAALEPVLVPAAVPGPIRLGFFVLNLGAPSLTAFVLLSYFLRERDLAREALADEHRNLEVERARSERLLLNVLPASIADRLKEGERTIADVGEATVLFADIVGFTPFARRRAPEHVVAVLNDVFTWLDALADRFEVEKIKTIGDAYMAVAGLPTPRPDHATATAEMALEIVHSMPPFLRGDGELVQMRIGIDTGPVVAGVIGRRRFSYDLWGDTVNTASRMETTGVPGRIQVTQRVVEALGDRYVLEPRGEIQIKGKGRMDTWFLLGRRIADEAAESATRGFDTPGQPSPAVERDGRDD